MVRAPCCEGHGLKKGAWTPQEDQILIDYIDKHGHGRWRSLPKLAGLNRCGKSCRLRWTNYLRPDIKRGPFTPDEENTIIQLHGLLGSRWAAIARSLPGRTDNEIKNFWITQIRKRLPSADMGTNNMKSQSSATNHMVQWESARVEAEARLSMESSSLINHSSMRKTSSDIYLYLWHSEVGESFRKINRRAAVKSESPNSPTSSLAKCGASTSTGLMNQQSDSMECTSRAPTGVPAKDGSDCLSSFKSVDSSDFTLELLLDSPSSDAGFSE